MDEPEQDDQLAHEIKTAFGLRLRETRLAKGISQLDLGLDCGLSQTYLSEVESGKRNISLVNMSKLARSLGITLGELLRGM
jgi:transcriptional regulator with XRE-family HTH domain